MLFLHCSVQYIYCIDNTVNNQKHFFFFFLLFWKIKIFLGIKIRPNRASLYLLISYIVLEKALFFTNVTGKITEIWHINLFLAIL